MLRWQGLGLPGCDADSWINDIGMNTQGTNWTWSDSVSEQIRTRKNNHAVRWYVLVLPVSSKGYYRGNPAKGLQTELARRIRVGEQPFEYFAPSYVAVCEKRAYWSARSIRCCTITSSYTPRKQRSIV